MAAAKPTLKRILVLSLIIFGGWASRFLLAVDHPPAAAGPPHKVHIAFGFHVNLYHSFRGDTNDENGFGQDIRVIRHIIVQVYVRLLRCQRSDRCAATAHCCMVFPG